MTETESGVVHTRGSIVHSITNNGDLDETDDAWVSKVDVNVSRADCLLGKEAIRKELV